MGYKCKKCNSDIPVGSNYCTFCGAAVNNINNDSKLLKGIITGVVIIILIAVTAICMFSYSNNLSQSIADDLEEDTTKQDSTDIESETTDDGLTNDDGFIWGDKNEPLTYSCGGITFEIPTNFGYYDGIFQSENSRLIIECALFEDDFWDMYYYGTGKDYDELADSMIKDILEEPYRELALDSNIAGEKSRYYIYSGIMDGEQEKILIEFVLNSNNEKVIALLFRTDANHSEINDYIEMANSAEYTGAADSTENPRSPFYIEPNALVEDSEVN